MASVEGRLRPVSAVRCAAATGRWRRMPRLISGEELRTSMRKNTTNVTAATTTSIEIGAAAYSDLNTTTRITATSGVATSSAVIRLDSAISSMAESTAAVCGVRFKARQ